MEVRDYTGEYLKVGDIVVYIEKGYFGFQRSSIKSIEQNNTVVLEKDSIPRPSNTIIKIGSLHRE